MLRYGLMAGLFGGVFLFISARWLAGHAWFIVICSSVYALGARLVIPNASALAMELPSSLKVASRH